MYISSEQLEDSLKQLDPVHPFFGISFLAFKLLDLPIGTPEAVDIADQETAILEDYYNPLPNSAYYYVPLRSIGPKRRWVSKKKYPPSGLQKTRTTTFKDAFLHPSKNEWAWAPDYLAKLSAHLQDHAKIPAFHLAVWMLKDHEWPNGTEPEDIVEYFFTTFSILQQERDALFDTIIDKTLFSAYLLSDEPTTWKNLIQMTGTPPDASPDEGGGLESIELIGVGPVKHLELDFAQRLNIITGDNGLGKTFLLECAWWALSGQWSDPTQPAYPRPDSVGTAISFQISGSLTKPRKVFFNRNTLTWPLPDEKRPVLPGIVIYSRVDGSAMIWDPAKHYWSVESDRARGLITLNAIRLNQENIWNGYEIDSYGGKKQFISNGLIDDWSTWQYRQPTGTFDTFTRVLRRLSPHPKEITLIPGEPTRMSRDARVIPTLKLPYGDVPIVLLSAGIKRILSLAYLLVWAWEEHKEASKQIGKPVQSKIVIIIDEMEAHLHPQWQRTIVPALLDVIELLEARLEVQLIIATHSPLVMASVEPFYNVETDKLFTLDLNGQELEVREIPYIKRGSADAWLQSEVFDLKRAYSVDAENALIDAKKLQSMDKPDPEEVQEVSDRLVKYLPPLDGFWPRWKFFAEQHGASL